MVDTQSIALSAFSDPAGSVTTDGPRMGTLTFPHPGVKLNAEPEPLSPNTFHDMETMHAILIPMRTAQTEIRLQLDSIERKVEQIASKTASMEPPHVARNSVMLQRGNTRTSMASIAHLAGDHASRLPAVGPFAFEPWLPERPKTELPMPARRASQTRRRKSSSAGTFANSKLKHSASKASVSEGPSSQPLSALPSDGQVRQTSEEKANGIPPSVAEPSSAREAETRLHAMFMGEREAERGGREGSVKAGSTLSRMGSLLSSQYEQYVSPVITPTNDATDEVTSWSLEVWLFLNDVDSSVAARIYSQAMRYMILASVVVPLLQSSSSPIIDRAVSDILQWSFDVIFLLEVLLRFIVMAQPLKFWKNPFNIIDMLAAFPFVLRIIMLVEGTHNEDFLDLVYPNIVPVPRLLKILRTFQQFHLLLSAFKIAIEAMPILLYTLFAILLVSSSCLFAVEPRSNIPTLPEAMYCGIITMTTVGYGDLVPQTGVGRLCVGVLVVCGVLYMAMPIGIIGSAFQEVWRERDRILLMQRMHERLLFWGYTAVDMPELLMNFDSRRQGELAFPDFCAMVRKMGIVVGEDRAYKLFCTLDIDENGYLSAPELVRSLFPSSYKELYLEDDAAMHRKRSVYRQTGVSNIFVNKRNSIDDGGRSVRMGDASVEHDSFNHSDLTGGSPKGRRSNYHSSADEDGDTSLDPTCGVIEEEQLEQKSSFNV